MRILCLLLLFYPSILFGQTLILDRTESAFELYESDHIFQSIGEIRVFDMGGVPYRIDISSFNDGNLMSYSYSIPYLLYVNDDGACESVSCSSQVSTAMGSIFSPLNNDTARIFILISDNPAGNVPSGTYTDSLAIALVAL